MICGIIHKMSLSRYFTCKICKKDVTIIEFDNEENISEGDEVIAGMLMTSHLSVNHRTVNSNDSKTVSSLFTFRDEQSYEKVI